MLIISLPFRLILGEVRNHSLSLIDLKYSFTYLKEVGSYVGFKIFRKDGQSFNNKDL